MDRKEEDKETNTKEQEGCLDEEREECDHLSQLPAVEPLQPLFPLLGTEVCHSVPPPTTIKLLEPALHEHGQKCIDQNKRETEEKENIDRPNVGCDCEFGGRIRGGG